MTTSKMSPTEGLKTYEQQRRERLSDAINDYMCTDDFDPRQCYEEIIAEVISARDYHDKIARESKLAIDSSHGTQVCNVINNLEQQRP